MSEAHDPIEAVHQRLADLKRGESQSAQGVQVSAAWVIETVEALLLEIERLKEENARMTPADYVFVVQVLETPLGLSDGVSPDVRAARADILARYNQTRGGWPSAQASLVARAEWLREFVEGKK